MNNYLTVVSDNFTLLLLYFTLLQNWVNDRFITLLYFTPIGSKVESNKYIPEKLEVVL